MLASSLRWLPAFLLVLLTGILSTQTSHAAEITVPTGGTALVTRDDSDAFGVGKGQSGESHLVTVDGQSFKNAMQATVTKRGNSWDLESSVAPKGAFAQGDAILVHFWARTLQTKDESGQGLVAVSLGENSPPWTAQFSRDFGVGTAWQEFFLRGSVLKDHADGTLTLKFSFGQIPQTMEVGGVEILSYGKDKKPEDLPETRSTYAGREPDAPWRAAAEKRIQEIRMAPLSVQVIDRTGKLLPGVAVHVELKKHAFLFGTALNPSTLLTDDKPENALYRQRFLELFNAGSFYNSLKWPAWAGEWGPELSQDNTMKALEWLKAHDMTIRGHVLVWPSFHNMPAFIQKLQGKATPEELQRLVLSRIDEVTAATAPYISEWDVINEPRDNHDLMDIIGKQVMLDYFHRARNRMPNARLVLNDYSILSPLSDSASEDQYEGFAKYLIDNGAPIDGFGFQGHFGASVPSPMRMLSVLDRFAKLNRPIRVTEYTIAGDDNQLKADFTRDLLTVLFSHPDVVGFQHWGLDQVVNPDGSLTAVGEAFRQMVNVKWHTDLQSTTDAAGSVTSRGYLGQYQVTVTQGNRTLTVPFELRKDSDPLIVTLP